ncbi:MAG: acyltransferase [Pseudomonadota bacterium]
MSGSTRLEGLQALRAVAALLVAAFHLHAAAVTETGSSGAFAIFQRGDIGVDLFFVLSGFIITWSALQRPDLTARSFLAARFWRVVPPYWAALALYLIAFAGLAVVTGDTSRLTDGSGLITSVFLLPLSDHVVVVAWSLTLEIVFYVLFALAWFPWGKGMLLAVLFFWSAAAIAAEQTGHPDGLALLIHPSVPEFLMGAVVAWLVRTSHGYAGYAALFVGAALIATGVTGAMNPVEQSLGRAAAFGLPAALMIYGAAGIAWRVPRWVLKLGDASYMLYLLHLLVFYVAGRGIEMLVGFNIYTSPISMLSVLALATVTSIAAHNYAEQPYQRWSKQRRTGQISWLDIASLKRSSRS